MATIQDLERKYSKFIASQNDIVDMIASYGVDITKDTPYQQFAEMVNEAVSTKMAGIIDGYTEFEINERDFTKISSNANNVISKYAFYRRYSLKKVVIPDFIKSIGQYAFGSNSALIEVILNGNSQIEAGAFNGCTALEKFYLPKATSTETVPTLVNVSAFTGINTYCKFIAPDEESLDFYEVASNWNALFDSYEFTFEGATE